MTEVVPSKKHHYSGKGHVSALARYFPGSKARTPRTLINPIAVKLTHLHPNATIFYFASMSSASEVLPRRDAAYGTLQNSGVARVSPRGLAIVPLERPQKYIDADGKVHPLHMHFVYWDGAAWGQRLHTHTIHPTR